ncbi:hypothetical protein [uncultured Proteiniphilum sp.]|uniref:hypothetical protein n=1 Tax=uncultured Proteiniphilum sp. TaxID=497637 RepID=UPI000E8B71A1|nr:hypothetical protein [uncultured Proteiniphilum sp.]HBN06609.1 hypothetical protein [Bacteroidales bacterium]
MKKTNGINKINHFKRICHDKIFYEWGLTVKEIVIMSVFILTLTGIITLWIVNERRINKKYAKEFWELNRYYRQKEMNLDKSIYEEEFDIEKEYDYYFREKISLR